MLEFDGPMGQCFSRFPTDSSRTRGEKGRGGIDKNLSSFSLLLLLESDEAERQKRLGSN